MLGPLAWASNRLAVGNRVTAVPAGPGPSGAWEDDPGQPQGSRGTRRPGWHPMSIPGKGVCGVFCRGSRWWGCLSRPLDTHPNSFIQFSG